jgi:hypothetical protein
VVKEIKAQATVQPFRQEVSLDLPEVGIELDPTQKSQEGT